MWFSDRPKRKFPPEPYNRLPRLVTFVPLPLSPTAWVLVLLMLWHILNQKSGIMDGLLVQGAAQFSANLLYYSGLCVSILTSALLFQALDAATKRPRWLNVAVHLLFLMGICFLASYRYSTGIGLDFAILMDNASSGFSQEAWTVIIRNFKLDPVLIGLVLSVILVVLEVKRQRISKGGIQSFRFRKGITSVLVFGGVCLLPAPNFDEGRAFLASISSYFAQTWRAPVPNQAEYPYVQPGFSYSELPFNRPLEKPWVFLIMVESFNRFFVENKSPEGKPYTPEFNALIPQGLYIDQFFGNSIQTCRGHFASLFGVLPSVLTADFYSHPKIRLQSLPDVFKQNNYHTLFFQAYADLDFDNTRLFMLRHGMDDVRSASDFIKPEDAPYVWGWGPEDQVFYKRFFEYLDQLHSKDAANRPWFVSLPTISSHMNFDQTPESRRFLYPNPKSWRERYANVMYLNDRSLPVFFSELRKRSYLKNSVVIITADHAMPTGKHGIEYNQVGYYSDSYQIPFLMVWPGVLPPRRIRDVPFSQLDIAPTLIDVIGLKVQRHHFQGRSMFATLDPERPVHLIQPYNGINIGVIRYPWHYNQSVHGGHDFLYNLKIDPEETRNYIQAVPHDSPPIARFQTDVKTVFQNQQLLRTDKIWPEKRVYVHPINPGDSK